MGMQPRMLYLFLLIAVHTIHPKMHIWQILRDNGRYLIAVRQSPHVGLNLGRNLDKAVPVSLNDIRVF